MPPVVLPESHHRAARDRDDTAFAVASTAVAAKALGLARFDACRLHNRLERSGGVDRVDGRGKSIRLPLHCGSESNCTVMGKQLLDNRSATWLAAIRSSRNVFMNRPTLEAWK